MRKLVFATAAFAVTWLAVVAAYAAYNERLSVGAEIDTGYLEMVISIFGVSDWSSTTEDPVLVVDPLTVEYSDIRGEVLANSIRDDDGPVRGYKTPDGDYVTTAWVEATQSGTTQVTVRLYEVYPRYFWFVGTNVGVFESSGLHAKLVRIEFYDSSGGLLGTIVPGTNDTLLRNRGLLLDLNGDERYDVKLWYNNQFDKLLDLSSESWASPYLIGVVLDGVPEDSNLEFTMRLVFEHYVPRS